MPKRSAGILLYRRRGETVEVLLAHPGGPFWMRKDDGAWSIPKGEYEEGEDPLAAARREFSEETGFAELPGPFVALGEIRQGGGKVVTAWAAEGEFDPATLRSNTFTLEWPPRSGKLQEFAEIDRAAWFPRDAAAAKILKGQHEFLKRLDAALRGDPPRE